MARLIIRVLGFAGAAVLLQAGTALAQAEDARSADEIVSCVAANIPHGDELRSITLVTRDRAGAERVTRAMVFGRRTSPTSRRTLVRFSAPPDLVSSGFLVLQEEDSTEIWIHSPDLGRRRVETGEAAGQSLFGTGLSYEDLMQLMGLVETEAGKLRLGDDRIGDNPTYVLESLPEPGTSAYARIVSSVDKETCVPLEVKLYERIGSAPRKVIRADPEQIFEVRGVWIAHSATLWDYRDEKRTVLHVESVMPYLELPDIAFSPGDLGKVEPRIDIEVKFDPIEVKLN